MSQRTMGRSAIVLTLALAIGVLGLYTCWPRPADLHGFDPAAMARLDIGALPVARNDGQLEGMITDRDLALRVVAEGRDPRTTKVGEIGREGTVVTVDGNPVTPLRLAFAAGLAMVSTRVGLWCGNGLARVQR